MADDTEVKEKETKEKPEFGKDKPEATVTMVFPKKTAVSDENQLIHTFNAGIHEVPESLADNYYLAWCGVKKYGGGGGEKSQHVITDQTVEFLKNKNYAVVTTEDAAAFISRMSEEDRDSFWKEADAASEKEDEDEKAALKAEEEGEGTEPTVHRPGSPPHFPPRRKVR